MLTPVAPPSTPVRTDLGTGKSPSPRTPTGQTGTPTTMERSPQWRLGQKLAKMAKEAYDKWMIGTINDNEYVEYMEHIRERHVKDKQAAREKTPEARSKAQAAVKSAQGTEPLKSEVYEVAHTQPRVQWKEVSQTAGLSGVNAKSRTKINREPLKKTQELKEAKETPATPANNQKGTPQDKAKQTLKGNGGETRV